MNQTYVHMHDGETVYYEDACFVCEAKNTTEAAVDDSPWSVIESVKYQDLELQQMRREFSWYDIRDAIRTLTFLVAFVASWLIVIILFDLITRGTVKWLWEIFSRIPVIASYA